MRLLRSDLQPPLAWIRRPRGWRRTSSGGFVGSASNISEPEDLDTLTMCAARLTTEIPCIGGAWLIYRWPPITFGLCCYRSSSASPRPRRRPFCEDDHSRNTGPGVWSKNSSGPLPHARTSLQAQINDKSGSVDPFLGPDCTHPYICEIATHEGSMSSIEFLRSTGNITCHAGKASKSRADVAETLVLLSDWIDDH
jgi:hypothetical protein